jgi:S-adenosylmethionine:tRNA ribosyltransferase-isomerase
MNINDFDYDLPEHLIAQTPVEPRDHSRLMVVSRQTGQITHRIFHDIVEYLRAGDVLVLNDTRVIPARIAAIKSTGGSVEILLLRQVDDTHWRALVGGKRIQIGAWMTVVNSTLQVQVTSTLEGPERVVNFSEPVQAHLDQIGQMPLPPYIKQAHPNPERYQTVYNAHQGSAAAPTAGLHFTTALLNELQERGVGLAYCTLHVGLGTFQPVKAEQITDHVMHYEWAQLSASAADQINAAKRAGHRVIAVGTTSARTLETAGILHEGGQIEHPDATPANAHSSLVAPFASDTNLFIYPGYRWRVVDGMITNFHLPRSTLLMMLSALLGRERLLHAYEVAKAEGYRFYSFGDAMFIE